MKPFSEERPWGDFRQFTHNEKTTVKILTVHPGQEFSLQYHNYREEFWRVLSGDPEVIIGDKTVKAKEGEEFLVFKGQLHRIRGGQMPARILEIAFGDFKEDDIVRVEDRYGRA